MENTEYSKIKYVNQFHKKATTLIPHLLADKVVLSVAAGFIVLFLGVLDKQIDQSDIEADAVGAGAAMLSIAVFHW
jgi:hypothetical protein